MQNVDTIFYQVDKREIEQLKFGRIRQMITELEKAGKESCQKLSLFIDGYNDVVEELYEIKEVREWVRELIDRFPNLFYFIDQATQNHKLLLMCVSTIKVIVFKGDEPKKPIDAYSYEDWTAMPDQNILVSINPKLLAKVKSKAFNYGLEIGDIKGVQKVAEGIDAFGVKT